MNAAGEPRAHDLGERVQRLALCGMEEHGLGVAEVLAPNGLDEGLGDELHDQLGRPVVRFHLGLTVLLHIPVHIKGQWSRSVLWIQIVHYIWNWIHKSVPILIRIRAVSDGYKIFFFLQNCNKNIFSLKTLLKNIGTTELRWRVSSPIFNCLDPDS